MPISRTVAALVGCVAIAACASQGAAPSGGASPSGGTSPSSGEARWTVGPALADCVAVGPTWCLQVRTAPAGPWTHHHGPIEGFRFVPADWTNAV